MLCTACSSSACLCTCCVLSGLWCSDITPQHRRLAEITEMIHTASLVHDDVVDNCSIRRGTLLLLS